MRVRLLILFLFSWSLGYLLVALWLFGQPEYPIFRRIDIELVKIMGMVGCWIAAFSFSRGEYLRRAWFLLGFCFFLLLVRDVTLAAWFEPLHLDILQIILVILANVFAVCGMVMLARVWREAGLDLLVAKWKKVFLLALAFIVSLSLAGPTIVRNFVDFLNGDLYKMTRVASGLGDMVSLVLIVPVFLTARALKGGILAWPWAFLAASFLASLCYDAAAVLFPALGADEMLMDITAEFSRTLAMLLMFSSGVSQRWVIVKTRRRNAQSKKSPVLQVSD
jgi:hypothetical protein